jgi:hypothetical protein
MSYKNKEELRNHIGKVGLFYNNDDEKTHKIGRLVSVTKNGNVEDEDQTYFDEFTPMSRTQMLELIDLEFYS